MWQDVLLAQVARSDRADRTWRFACLSANGCTARGQIRPSHDLCGQFPGLARPDLQAIWQSWLGLHDRICANKYIDKHQGLEGSGGTWLYLGARTSAAFAEAFRIGGFPRVFFLLLFFLSAFAGMAAIQVVCGQAGTASGQDRDGEASFLFSRLPGNPVACQGRPNGSHV